MRGTVWAAGAAAAAVALAAGCGTVRYGGAAGPGDASTGHGSGASFAARTLGPPTITRQQAERLARALLPRAPLPAGARRLTGPPVAVLGQPPGGEAGAPVVWLHELWTVPAPEAAVYAFVLRHVPAGMTLGPSGGVGAGAGQTGNGTAVPAPATPRGTPQGAPPRPATAPRGLGDQPVKVATPYEEEDALYQLKRLPVGVSGANLSMAVAPAGNGVSELRVDAEVIWYPPRSAAEHIPAGTHSVTITASTFMAGRGTLTKTFTSPGVVARLVAMLNGAHASDLGIVPCPLALATYRLAFATSPRAAPYLVATDPGCPGIAVSVGGHAQPSLQVPPALQTTLAALMHVRGLPGPGGIRPGPPIVVSPPVVAPGPPTCVSVKPTRGVRPGFRENRDAGTLPAPCPMLSPVA